MASIHEINRARKSFDEKNEKKKSIEIKTFEINKDEKIILKSNSFITISKDSNLIISYEKDFCGKIEIEIKKGVKANLLEVLDDKEIHRDMKIDVQKDAKIIHGFSNKASRYAKTIVNLSENANYNLKGAYYIDAIESFIRFETYHKGQGSSSNMQINGASINGAKVICDALVNIAGKAIKSSGHQKLYGLLLDEHSRILSEPILEINNNDVSCSHAASISQINDEAQFYMQSRGLSKQEVIDMFIDGFFQEVKDVTSHKNELII